MNSPTTDQPNPQELLSPEEARLRTELYRQQRLEFQDRFYRSRIREFSQNSNLMLVFSAVLMFIAGITSAWSAVSHSATLAFITALLPASAAAVATFRTLYQWERQAALYSDTRVALREAKLELDDPEHLEPEDYLESFPNLVQKSEIAFQKEASQWGQILISSQEEDDNKNQKLPL